MSIAEFFDHVYNNVLNSLSGISSNLLLFGALLCD